MRACTGRGVGRGIGSASCGSVSPSFSSESAGGRSIPNAEPCGVPRPTVKNQDRRGPGDRPPPLPAAGARMILGMRTGSTVGEARDRGLLRWVPSGTPDRGDPGGRSHPRPRGGRRARAARGELHAARDPALGAHREPAGAARPGDHPRARRGRPRGRRHAGGPGPARRPRSFPLRRSDPGHRPERLASRPARAARGPARALRLRRPDLVPGLRVHPGGVPLRQPVRRAPGTRLPGGRTARARARAGPRWQRPSGSRPSARAGRPPSSASRWCASSSSTSGRGPCSSAARTRGRRSRSSHPTCRTRRTRRTSSPSSCPPPARAAFQVKNEDGAVRLRASAGVHQKLRNWLRNQSIERAHVDFRVTVNGEERFAARVPVTRHYPLDPRDHPEGAFVWHPVGGEDGLALEPGDRVVLETSVPVGDPRGERSAGRSAPGLRSARPGASDPDRAHARAAGGPQHPLRRHGHPAGGPPVLLRSPPSDDAPTSIDWRSAAPCSRTRTRRRAGPGPRPRPS